MFNCEVAASRPCCSSRATLVLTMRMTAEEAVRWYRAQPGNDEAMRANYFDLPVPSAARRYAAPGRIVSFLLEKSAASSVALPAK